MSYFVEMGDANFRFDGSGRCVDAMNQTVDPKLCEPPGILSSIVNAITKPVETLTGKPAATSPTTSPARPSAAQIEAATIKGRQIAEAARAKAAPSFWDRLSSGLSIAGKMQTQPGVQTAAPSSIPWTPILAVGAGVVVLAVLLKKKG